MNRLNDIEKKNPFRVPDNYFEEVNKKIISSLPEKSSQPRKSGFIVRLKPYLAVAASVTLLIAISYSGFRLFSGERRNYGISELSIQELSDAYLNEAGIQIVDENVSYVIQNIDLPEMTKSEIIDYLISENIELNEIYENL